MKQLTKRIISILMGGALAAFLFTSYLGVNAAADSGDVLPVTFTQIEEPKVEAGALADPVIINLSSLADLFSSDGGLVHQTTNNIGGTTKFQKLEDGTGCAQVIYAPYLADPDYKPYRVVFASGNVTPDHKYIRVTYMTTDTTPAMITLINTSSKNTVTLENDTSKSAGTVIRTDAVNIKGDLLNRLTSGKSCGVMFSNPSENAEIYVKEIAFFTDADQAYTYYGEEPGAAAGAVSDYYTMSFGGTGNAMALQNTDASQPADFYGNNEYNKETKSLDISYAESTNHKVHYMAKIKFNDKNLVNTQYRYVRVLYSAKNPAGTKNASLYITNDGPPYESVLIQENIPDTNGKFVLSDTAYMSDTILNRFGATVQHCSLKVNAANDGGLYSIKEIYFFETRADAEGFVYEGDIPRTISIAGNDISKYQIVVDDEAAPIIVRAAEKFAAHIDSIIGVKVPIVTDETAESEYEILFGASSRAKSNLPMENQDPEPSDYRMYATALDGNTLILAGANAYTIEDAANFILENYLFYGISTIPKTINIKAPCAHTGVSKLIGIATNKKVTGHTNVEDPYVFTEDFAADNGYFAEEDNTSNWAYVNGEYTTTAGAKRNLSYVHVYEADVDYTAKLKYTTAGANGDMGIMLRYLNEYAYAKAGYDFENGEWYIEYREGEDFYTHRIASAKATLTPGTQYTLRFVADDMNAKLYVDGAEILSTDKLHHILTGRIAVYAEDAAVAVDDVKAVLLSGEGTILSGIYHANLDKGAIGNGASFVELSDGSIYFHTAKIYSNVPSYISKDDGQTWTKTENLLISKGWAHPLVLNNGELLEIVSKDSKIKAMISTDDGKTWTERGVVCPATIDGGYIVNNMNDKVTQSPTTGRIFYVASAGANGDTIHTSFFFYSDDNGATWIESDMNSKDIPGIEEYGERFSEGKIIECADGTLRLYVTWGGISGCVIYSESADNGMTWGPITKIPELYVTGSSSQIIRDPYAENDHTYYMVFVYSELRSVAGNGNRSRLALVKSEDGKNWSFVGDLWRGEQFYTHHGGHDFYQVVNPSIGISENALFVGAGVPERLRPDGSDTAHGDQQQHIWVINRDSLTDSKPMNKFTDLKVGAKYYDAVSFVNDKGLFTGTSDTTFAPDAVMDRSMFVTVLGRLDGADVSKYTTPTFSDVVAGQWYTSYVEWAAATGVVNGIGNGMYGVTGEITVEQACVMLARYAGNKAAASQTGKTSASFADASAVSAWAKDGVEWAIANGIYYGQNGIINPTANASRALVATMFYNFVNVFGE